MSETLREQLLINEIARLRETLQTVRDWCDSENIWSRDDLHKLVAAALNHVCEVMK